MKKKQFKSNPFPAGSSTSKQVKSLGMIKEEEWNPVDLQLKDDMIQISNENRKELDKLKFKL